MSFANGGKPSHEMAKGSRNELPWLTEANVTFPYGKPTALRSRSRHATHAALPWVGFDFGNAALWRFLRSG